VRNHRDSPHTRAVDTLSRAGYSPPRFVATEVGFLSKDGTGRMVRVELSRIVINEKTDDEQQITLREADGAREFSIFVGIFEASAIERIVKERPSERPLTHDLLVAIAESLEGKIVRAVIDDLKDDTFYAKVVVKHGKEEVAIDARPSDAITLALKVDAPIYVAEKVMKAAAPG
jgi:bifunctional DNase/RNase